MGNMRLLLIAAAILVAVVALLTLELSAAEFGIVLLGGAAAVAVVMFFITRRRYQRMTDAEGQPRAARTLGPLRIWVFAGSGRCESRGCRQMDCLIALIQMLTVLFATVFILRRSFAPCRQIATSTYPNGLFADRPMPCSTS